MIQQHYQKEIYHWILFQFFLDYFSDSRVFGEFKNPPIMMIRTFLISVYIYYQNKNSPLMKIIQKRRK